MFATKKQLAAFALCLFALNLADAQAQISKFRSARFRGEDYVAVSDLARHFELGVDRDESPRRSRYRSLEVEADKSRIVLDGVAHWLNKPIVAASGRLWIARVDVLKVVDPVLRPQQFRAARRPQRVVLDPGHGGADRGTIGRAGRPEKELALDLTQRVAAKLKGAGAEIILTRATDTTMSLPARAAFARARKADLFVSLHFNAATPAAHGIETFVLPPRGYSSTGISQLRARDGKLEAGNRFDLENLWLAHCIQKALLRRTDSLDRGVRRARFQVLRDAPCPAALVEAGFLSNPREEAKILTVAYRETLASAIADGILAYLKSTER